MRGKFAVACVLAVAAGLAAADELGECDMSVSSRQMFVHVHRSTVICAWTAGILILSSPCRSSIPLICFRRRCAREPDGDHLHHPRCAIE